MVHARVFPSGEAEGRLYPEFPLVEERSSQDGKYTCYTPFRNHSGNTFDGDIRTGGVRDTTVQGSRTQDSRELSLQYSRASFAEMGS